jgi:hypothetical protein
LHADDGDDACAGRRVRLRESDQKVTKKVIKSRSG